MTHTFAITDEIAADKYELYKSKDPFTNIPPSLLSSADIMRYVEATGMIHPFHLEPERELFKPASYGVKMLGDIITWDEQGSKIKKTIMEKEEYELKSNSITFVVLEPMFRIPNYIALRFNLKIKHIHQGILLGTGPLLDPGFEGKLLIPLHNLTNNSYILRGGDVLVWMEFSKISKGDIDIKAEAIESKPFPKEKKIINPDEYLFKANQGKSIQSSLPAIVQQADQFKEDVRRELKNYRNYGFVAFVGIVIGLIYPGYHLVSNTITFTKQIEEKNIQKAEALNQEIQKLKEEIKRTEKVNKDIQELKMEINKINMKKFSKNK